MMRPSELPAAVVALADQLFHDARSVLVVGAAARLHAPRLAHVSSASEVRADMQHDAVLLYVDREVHHSLGVLRPLLADRAPLLLVARTQETPLARLRALVARERTVALSAEALCEAVLLRGLGGSRVHALVQGWLVVSARMPAQRDPLDAVFEQPAPAPHR